MLFVFGIIGWILMSMVHAGAALEFAQKKERGTFERICLALGVLVLWPLFSFGMMCSGYSHFWHKIWGDKPSWERDGKV